LVTAIGQLADQANHHPDVILTYLAVIITLTTHEQGMVTAADITLADEINQLWDRDFAAPGGKVA
jgi:4a-hydroxytetrahydrobiopterin dehydratase